MEESVSRYANYECLKIEVADKVATVTLNRPQARNAIDPDTTPIAIPTLGPTGGSFCVAQ